MHVNGCHGILGCHGSSQLILEHNACSQLPFLVFQGMQAIASNQDLGEECTSHVPGGRS